MNIGLDLNIFCFKDEDIKAVDLEIEVPLSECELRPFTFYNIDFIAVDRDNPNYTCISSGGDDFVTNERYEVVKHKIEQLRILKYN